MIDDHTRERVCIEIDFSLPASRVLCALDWLIEWHSRPEAIRFDNGREFINRAMHAWVRKHGIRLEYIQPGKPQQNAYAEPFNRTTRQEVSGDKRISED